MASKVPIGLGFMGLGGFMVWGGITGRLAPMVAAVFSPSLLQPSNGGGFPLLADINPARGGELVPPGTGPGSDGTLAPPTLGTPTTGELPGASPIELGPGSILEILP